jgi:GT2 family glycosyltransferase
VLQRSTHQNLEVVLVENNSVEDQTFELYNTLQSQDARVRVVVWEPPEPGAFNYSALVNYGVSQATGEFIVLLNNDTEVIESRWLQEMLGCLMRPEVGGVGAKLLFGDGLIQHVGMVANPEGGFCHVCQNLTSEALGPTNAAMMPGDYSMVTGACQAMRRALFEELGGYDEELAVGFNDGDFCLRAQEAGYAITVCAHALLHHREFSTRGRESTDARLRKRHMLERARVVARHADFFAQGDPALNPNLDGFSGYFTLPPNGER